MTSEELYDMAEELSELALEVDRDVRVLEAEATDALDRVGALRTKLHDAVNRRNRADGNHEDAVERAGMLRNASAVVHEAAVRAETKE